MNITDADLSQDPLSDMLEGIQKRYKRRFPDVLDVMAVSCKSKRGVRELQQRIVEVAEKKRYVGQEVSPSWLILSRHIELMQNKQPPLMVSIYLLSQPCLQPLILFLSYAKTYQEFEQHALEYNVSKEHVPDALAFLHKIGDVAYFGEDPAEGN